MRVSILSCQRDVSIDDIMFVIYHCYRAVGCFVRLVQWQVRHMFLNSIYNCPKYVLTLITGKWGLRGKTIGWLERLPSSFPSNFSPVKIAASFPWH